MVEEKPFRDIDLNKILQMARKNDRKEKEIIEFHYKIALNRIKRAYENYEDFCYYDVSTFEPSLPFYDANDITQKLIKYMKKKGFQGRIIYNNRLMFFWKPKTRKKEHVDYLYKVLIRKIENCAKEKKDSCIFSVPPILAAYSWYDANDVAVEIARKIDKKGFIVDVNDNVINVNWNVKNIERKTKKKIKFKTLEEKRKEALEKINYINEKRYVDFVNPKKFSEKKSLPDTELYPEKFKKSKLLYGEENKSEENDEDFFENKLKELKNMF